MTPPEHRRDPLHAVDAVARIVMWTVAAALPALLALRVAVRLASD